MSDPRVLFAGTPAFARASLEALVDAGRRPVAVLTQPDRRAGRGKRLTAGPVKRYAVDHGIPVLQPDTLRSDASAAEIAALRPDVLVVAAYGLILPPAILGIPPMGCLNVHASLLPRWRGAAPIQAAILAGDQTTGISLMAMTAGLDCGPVFSKASIGIGSSENAGELQQRLAMLGGRLLVSELDAILAGDRQAEEQDESQATYAGKISTNDARLDWSLSAIELERCVRAYNPVPGAWFMLGDERIKCWRASVDERSGLPGRVLTVSERGVVVGCGETSLSLEELQRPGKRPVDAATIARQLDFARATLD